MALTNNITTQEVEDRFANLGKGPFAAFNTIASLEANTDLYASGCTKLSLGTDEVTNMNFFNDLECLLAKKVGDKTYGIFDQGDGVYLVAIKQVKTKHFFTPIVRTLTEPFSGEYKDAEKKIMKTTATEYNGRTTLGKVFFATNGPLFDGIGGELGKYSSENAAIGTHRIKGKVIYQDPSNASNVIRLPFEAESVKPPTKRSHSSPNAYFFRTFFTGGELEFGFGDADKDHDPDFGVIRSALGGSPPLLMTYAHPTVNDKFTITFGVDNIYKDANIPNDRGKSHTDKAFLKTLKTKSYLYWSKLEGMMRSDIMGYNILAYHPAKDIVLVILHDHKKREWTYTEFANRLLDLGFEYAVSFDNSDSVFLYDYDLKKYQFMTNDTDKDHSTEVGYGFTY